MNRHMRRKMSRLQMLRAPGELDGIGDFGDPNGYGQQDGNFGGGGGGGQQRQQNDTNGTQHQQGPLFGQEEDDGVDQDLQDMFAQFAPAQGEQQEDNGFQLMEDVTQERITEMQNSVANQINNMQLPQDFLPADFDPSNPQQLNQAFRSVMQHTLRNALNVVFQPTQLAMQSMNANFQNMLNQKITESRTGMQDQQVIETEVPEINDPTYGPMLKLMDSTLKSKGKKPQERAKTLRKMLNQMGVQQQPIGSNSRRTANPGAAPASSGVTHGKNALDKFFGGFGTPQPQQRQGGQQQR